MSKCFSPNLLCYSSPKKKIFFCFYYFLSTLAFTWELNQCVYFSWSNFFIYLFILNQSIHIFTQVQNECVVSSGVFVVPPRTGQMSSRTGGTKGHAHLQQDGEEGELLPHVRLQGSLPGRWVTRRRSRSTRDCFTTTSNFLWDSFRRVGQQLLGQLRHPHLQREVSQPAQHQQQSQLHRFATRGILFYRFSQSATWDPAHPQAVSSCVLLPTLLCLSVETLAPPMKHTASFKIKNAKCHLHPKLTGRTEDRGRTLGPGLS